MIWLLCLFVKEADDTPMLIGEYVVIGLFCKSPRYWRR